MSQTFGWDEEKADRNLSKHGVSFAEGSTVFTDPLSLTIPDPLHSADEERLVTLGLSYRERLIVVVYAEREERVRIISARPATPRERNDYEERRGQ